MSKKAITIALAFVVLVMGVFFLLGTPVMMDDGFHYEGFAEALARGELNFRDYYGFQGLSFFAVPIYWLTQSHNSIIYTSMIFALLSIPLAYAVGKAYYKHEAGGIMAMAIVLLMPYPFVTMMRGFQEAALLFFILLIIYGAIQKKVWTGLAWGISGIVKPFALVLAPLFMRRGMKKFEIWCLVLGICVIGAYGIANYAQTGHFVTLAATGAYQGVFDADNIPALQKSFTLDWKSWARVPANLLVSSRKIMISPLIILLGAISLWYNKSLLLRKKIILAIVLNIILVGFITYAFPKYLLPTALLLGMMAIPMILTRWWILALVLVDSIFVFIPIYKFFGHTFWNGVIFWVPFLLAVILSIYAYRSYHSNPARTG